MLYEVITLRVRLQGRVDTVHDAGPEGFGEIDAEIKAGVITLNGQVLSLTHKRMLGVLAWWTPGCRDVVNGIAVEPEEQDSDDEIVDAVRLALEMDPMLVITSYSIHYTKLYENDRHVLRNSARPILAARKRWATK